MLRRLLPVTAIAALLALAPAAHAARSVYFADHHASSIAQFSVGAGGVPAPLVPATVPAGKHPLRLAMTPEGDDLYATSKYGVLQYDVAPSGALTPKQDALVYTGGSPHSIAIHPAGSSAYVTDAHYGKVRQFDVGPGGALVPKDPPYVKAGDRARGVAVSPGGRTAYVLVEDGIVVYDVGPGGALTRRPGEVDVPGCSLEDVALTPDGAHLYATSGDGRVFQFGVGPGGTLVAKSPAAVSTGQHTHPVGLAVGPDGDAVHVTVSRGWWSPREVLGYTVGAGGALSLADSAAIAGHGSKLGYLTPSPDGRSLFVAGGDAHLFDLGPLGSLAPKTPASLDLHGALGVVVSPNQAPVARFVAAAGSAGSATQFNASSAVDPDGTIVRYDWDFGDGTQLLNGGPTPEHVYSRPGSYRVTLVVTDNEGASTATIFTGGTVLENGAPGAQASQVIQVAAAPAQAVVETPPPVLPGPLQIVQAPVPDLGETLVADPVRGTVLVRLPGRRRFVPLQTVTELPLGSTLDTRRGRVNVATERRRPGRVQEGRFFGGVFAVRQRRRTRFVTELILRGDLTCGKGLRTAARRTRRLWGRADGRFRTRGRYSSGTVRGTRWLTVDRCDGTLTVVREGTVAVQDLVLDRTVLVDAGERYLARAP
jgi:DNA-binding beta-propeller fold protein YncE